MTAVSDSPPPHQAVTDLDRAEWRILKTMRLKALADAPYAFVTDWAAEWRMGPAEWLDRFTGRTWVAARVDGEVVGVACLAPSEPHEAQGVYVFVESVWVDPQHRFRGLLRQMLDRLELHAHAAGVMELRLWILDTNEAAGRAYQKLGFSPVVHVEQDTTKRREDGTPVKERLMSKPLL